MIRGQKISRQKNPVGRCFLNSKKTREYGPPDFFLDEESRGEIRSVPFPQLKKTQGLNPVRFLKLHFLPVHER